MRFQHPEFFALFVPLILVALYQLRQGVRLRGRVDFPSTFWMDARPKLGLPSPFKVHWLLRLIGLSFLIVALARPQKVFTKVSKNVEGIDIIISFDLSKSMDALDFAPNRRVVAVKTTLDFIDRRPNDRIGLVLFSGEAYLATPLTTDHKILKDAVSQSSNRLLQDGTAIGQSLAVGVNHLRNSTARSRVLILVTDGDNNMGSVDPPTAAELAKGFGVKIYTIGMGKKGRVKFPVTTMNPFTQREETVYQWLDDAVNDELLEQIAKHTGGRFFRATDSALLEEIFSTIDTLEKTKIDTQTYVRFSELAWPFLVTGLLILLAEALALNTRWRKLP
jgi:Ca-activated chloride channel homolog